MNSAGTRYSSPANLYVRGKVICLIWVAFFLCACFICLAHIAMPGDSFVWMSALKKFFELCQLTESSSLSRAMGSHPALGRVPKTFSKPTVATHSTLSCQGKRGKNNVRLRCAVMGLAACEVGCEQTSLTFTIQPGRSVAHGVCCQCHLHPHHHLQRSSLAALWKTAVEFPSYFHPS